MKGTTMSQPSYLKLADHYSGANKLSKKELNDALNDIKDFPKLIYSLSVNHARKRLKRIEKGLLKDVDLLVDYCVDFRFKWTEVESKIILASPKKIFEYFTNVFCNHGINRWIEAEQSLSRDLNLFYSYVRFCKEKCETFEQKILNDPDNVENPRLIYGYSSFVLGKRWKQAESILFKNAQYAAKYSNKFNVLIPEETHNQILAEVAFSKPSASKKRYLDKIIKTKKIVKDYINELLNKNIVQKDSTIDDFLETIK